MQAERNRQVRGTHPQIALSAENLTQRLGVSLRHIRRMDSAGKLPCPIRLGASARWPVAKIEEWLSAGAPDRRTWLEQKGDNRD